MSVEIVKKQIADFLRSDTPEVLAIKGAWGVGKTYAWKRYVEEFRDSISLKKYSYVSLFGINSLDTLKYQIFEQSIHTRDIGRQPDIDTFVNNTDFIIKKIGKNSLKFLKGLPYLEKNYATIESFSFLVVNKMIICFDDFERLGDSLNIKDVFGLANLLKEEKKCKVVLIFNEDSMDEEQKENLSLYREKVVDVELVFAPNAIECVEIALVNDNKVSSLISEHSVKLDIDNIRIIRKIERLSRLVAKSLTQYEPEVLRQAIQTLSLFALSYYSKDERIPPEEFLLKYNSVGYYMKKDEKLSDDERLWHSFLSQYNFTYIDDFDEVIISAIKCGYFDDSKLISEAEKLNQKIIAKKSDNSFMEAWYQYLYSFQNNEDEVLEGLYNGAKNHSKYISLNYLNATVVLLREFGRDEQADEVIDVCIESMKQKDEKRVFDLSIYPFSDTITDKTLIKKLNDQNQQRIEEKTLEEIVQKIANRDGYEQSDLITMSQASENEYFKLFKSKEGPNLRLYVEACLQFRNTHQQQEIYKTITKKTISALKNIAGEDALNKRRVQINYGICLDE